MVELSRKLSGICSVTAVEAACRVGGVLPEVVARPRSMVHLELQNVALLGQRVFADIISEVVLGWGKPSRSDW